jgi:hypothetical protein
MDATHDNVPDLWARAEEFEETLAPPTSWRESLLAIAVAAIALVFYFTSTLFIKH